MSIRTDFSRRSFVAAAFLGAAFATLSLAASVRADIADPNTKYITHLVRFENLNRYAKQYKFYLVAYAPGSTKRIISADPIPASGEIRTSNYYRHNRLYLGALPTAVKTTPTTAAFEKPTNGAMITADPIERRSSVPRSEPHDTYLTRYKVAIVVMHGDKDRPPTTKLSLALVSSGWADDAPGEETARAGFLLGVPLFALLGLVGRLRPRAEEQAE